MWRPETGRAAGEERFLVELDRADVRFHRLSCPTVVAVLGSNEPNFPASCTRVHHPAFGCPPSLLPAGGTHAKNSRGAFLTTDNWQLTTYSPTSLTPRTA